MTMVPPTQPGSAGFDGYAASSHSPLPGDRLGSGRTYSTARNAVVLGILSILPFSIVAGIPAIWLGIRALKDIRASESTLHGRGAAWFAIVLGAISVLVFLAIVAPL